MFTNKIDLSIIIVNYKTKEFLIPCLSSIHETTQDLNLEVIVIDNDSKDNSVKTIKELFPWIMLIENKTNRGFVAASNQGLRMMRGDFALLLNPDTEVMNGTLTKMVEYMKNNQRVGMLGCKITDKQGKSQISCHPTPSPSRELNYLFYRLKLDNILPLKTTFSSYKNMIGNCQLPIVVGWISGACLMIKREVIQDIGLLDENLFMFSEDVDWCMRAKKKGWEVIYHPSVRIFHYAGGSSKTDIEGISVRIKHEYESRLYFAKKHYGKIGSHFVKLVLCSELLGKIIITELNMRSRITKPIKEKKLKGYLLALRAILRMSKSITIN